MKTPAWLFVIVSVLVLFVGGEASAQCSVSYSPDFSVWENVSADATNIYTEVGMDGSGTMTLSGEFCDLPEIVHTAYLWNSVGSASSGWVPSGDYCPDCYVSTEQDETLAYDPAQTYTFDYEGEMDCNIGGIFFSDGGFIGIRIAITTYHIQSVNANGSITFIQACPGRSVASCGATYLTGSQPTIWAEEFQLGVTVGGSQPLCSPIGIVQYFNGPPAPYQCQ